MDGSRPAKSPQIRDKVRPGAMLLHVPEERGGAGKESPDATETPEAVWAAEAS